MNDPANPHPAEPESEVAAEFSFLLTSLEVFNWGPFQGKHRCEIDPGGSAIIGPTGSGKTTLIDALMTLLARNPKYNLASTGGHESDRDLISYVRGVSGTESAGGENDHVARPAKTITGLCASYLGGHEQISIGAIFWVDSSSNAADDLKKLWFFNKDSAQPLDQLLRLHHEGGKQAITRHARDTVGLRLFGSKSEYLAQVRGFFEVSENAFSLLNRAAGLKQINSIDQIFRELVLDDRSAFDRAQEVAAEFDTLQSIYAELETARRQRDSLLPVQTQQAALETARAKLARRQHLKALLPAWFADIAMKLWQIESDRICDQIAQTQEQLNTEEGYAIGSKAKVDTLYKKFLNVGGASVQGIEEAISANEKLVASIRRNAEEYQRLVRQFDLPDELSESAFIKNLAVLPELNTAAQMAHEGARKATLETESKLQTCNHREITLTDEIRSVRARPHSNIPANFQTFREALAAHLHCAADRLPFVAELVEVKGEESHWRGAIERAIGSERLRILVSHDRMSQALSWINHRDNRLHVRLQGAEPSPPIAHFFDDGYTRKLNYRDHPLRENVKHLLSKRDRHCVQSTEALEHTDQGMTAEGTMSDRDGRFEKQDQRPLNEGWMTGFDNSHQLQSLAGLLIEIRGSVSALNAKAQEQSVIEVALIQRIAIITQLQNLNFDEIGLPRVERELDELRERLANLIRPGSDTAKAKSEYDAEVDKQKEIAERISSLTRTLGGHEAALGNAKEQHQQAVERRSNGLTEEDAKLAAKVFPVSESVAVKHLGDVERKALVQIEERIERAEQQKSDTEKRLIRAMEGAKREDTGILTETGTDLRDVPDYLKRLKVLQEEALPEKLSRFLEYLNHSSGQGVTQLLSHIENEVAIIEERVADLNATLSRVDFRQGQFLQLYPERIVHESLRQVESAHRKLRHIALKAEDDQGDAHYRALGDVIRLIREAGENRRTLAAQALLDPRHRLQFFVFEMNRSTGQTSGRRTGSQTGSGGEKEMMASYILTASLSYALCPGGATKPRYATIVLDEAFSKSSPAASSRIIEALRVFGLHPLFVTPNKEIALLKAHTRSAILVHNKDKVATLTSLTWQQIEAHARTTVVPP